ncbi:hypothetical protein AB0O01_28620 [Streptomyces sp. NPDC093252]
MTAHRGVQVRSTGLDRILADACDRVPGPIGRADRNPRFPLLGHAPPCRT